MANEAFWQWLVGMGVIQGDPNYYASGSAPPEEIEHALRTAWSGIEVANSQGTKDQFWSGLEVGGYIEGDPNYYSSGQATPEEFDNAFSTASNPVSDQTPVEPVSGEPINEEPANTGSDGDIWSDLVNAGILQGDPDWYSSGQASEAEFSNAISVAFKGTDPNSELRKGFIDFLFAKGGAQGDPNYWYGLASDSPEVSSLTELAFTVDVAGGGEDVEIKALPQNARLVNVNGEIRAIWDLGDGLGHAWYSINEDQLQDLYGENWQAYITETLGTEGAYNAKYGDFYWGNVAEINLTADNPWEDLKARTFEAFGYVAGFDDPEVKRLILQGHFETWSSDEFLAHYRNTEYYLGTTQTQRDWGQYGEEEKSQRIDSRSAQLVEEYRALYGVDPIDGINNAEIRAAAEAIESGESSASEWSYNQRREAEKVENSPAARALVDEERAQGESEVSIENRGGFARERWEYWMGSTPLPPAFVDRWGRDLYMNNASEDDLETSLRELSAGTWQTKPENIGWGEWASPVKANIRNLLELSSVDDNDPLLNRVLDQGLSGQDATLAIRKDQRFRSTNRMFDELAQGAQALGRTFGFIA